MECIASTLSAEQLLKIPLTEPERLFAPGLPKPNWNFATWHPNDDGEVFEVRYVRRHECELGEACVVHTAVAYALPWAQADLMTQAQRIFGQFVYADLRMREQIAAS